MAECIWVKPELGVQIDYTEWTDANHLRHSFFKCIREDKRAREVAKGTRGELCRSRKTSCSLVQKVYFVNYVILNWACPESKGLLHRGSDTFGDQRIFHEKVGGMIELHTPLLLLPSFEYAAAGKLTAPERRGSMETGEPQTDSSGR